MFKGRWAKSDIKTMRKRISWMLNSHMFSIDELKSLRPRKAKKVIKLIAKYEGIRLNRNEIKDILLFINSDFTTATETATKLWSFVTDYIRTESVNILEKVFYVLFAIFPSLRTYQMDRFDIQRP